MEKLKKHIIQELKNKRNDIKEIYLRRGYELAIQNLTAIFNENLTEDSRNMPSALDILLDTGIIEDRYFKSINNEDANKLFYYKLGWDRGNHRIDDIVEISNEEFSDKNLLLRKIS